MVDPKDNEKTEVGRKVPMYISCLCGNTFNLGKEGSHEETR